MPKKKTKAKAVLLQEQEAFQADTFDDPIDKNQKLADLLQGPWLDFAIVRIERIEIGSLKGWRAVHRT